MSAGIVHEEHDVPELYRDEELMAPESAELTLLISGTSLATRCRLNLVDGPDRLRAARMWPSEVNTGAARQWTPNSCSPKSVA